MHTFDPETERLIQANRANWDARTPIHLASAFYGLNGSRESASWFTGYEWEDLGELVGVDLLHLQCHLGTDWIALARGGARVVGLDISGASVRSARRIAADAGVSIEFVESNVYNAPTALGILPPPDGNEELLVRNDYLGGGTLEERDSTRTYTDGPPLAEATDSYEWRHDLGGWSPRWSAPGPDTRESPFRDARVGGSGFANRQLGGSERETRGSSSGAHP